MSEKINKGFNIKKAELDDRIEFKTQIPRGYRVVTLKEIETSKKVVPMTVEEMEAFLEHIPLMASKDICPYSEADFSQHLSGSNGLHVPQRFVQRSKLLSILEGLNPLYKGQCFPQLSGRTAHYIFGLDSEKGRVAGVYFPPLIEVASVGTQALLIDGNHRMTLCESIGASSQTILIKGSSVNPPYGGVPWHDRFVDEKPPLSERYVDFNPSLLKNFDWVGIDG